MGLQTGMLPSWRAVIGDEIDRLGLAHSVSFVEDDDASEVPSIKAHLDFARAQITWRFEADFAHREGVVSEDSAFFLDEEILVIRFASLGGRNRMRRRSRPKRSMGFMRRLECSRAW